MGARQRKRLLKRRRAAAERRTGRRTAVVTGATFAGLTGLMGGTLSPVVAQPDAGPVEFVGDLAPTGDIQSEDHVAWKGSLLFTAKTEPGDVATVWRATPGESPKHLFDSPPFQEETVESLTPFGDRFFFSAMPIGDDNRELWISDGTDDGTDRLTELPNPPVCDYEYCEEYQHGQYVGDMTVVNGTLVFARTDETRPGYTEDIWVSDGTAAGTRLAVDMPDSLETISDLTQFGDKVAMLGHYYDDGAGLWATDLTQAGTARLLPTLGQAEPDAEDLTPVGDGDLLFTRHDTLWRSDGTTAGTRKMRDLAPEKPHRGYPGELVPLEDGRVVFQAVSPPAVWVTDGTDKGTRRLRGLAGGERANGQVGIGGQAFFAVVTGRSTQLWRSDGTKAGTRAVTAFAGKDKGVTDRFPTGELVAGDGRVWFGAHTDEHGRELWSSDGTRRGTGRISDIAPDRASAKPQDLVWAADRLWFLANDATHGMEWWRTSLDTAVRSPKVQADPKQKQTKKAIKVVVRAGAAEHVKLRAAGTIKIQGVKKAAPLSVVEGHSAAGERARLTLTVRKKQQARVMRALRSHKAVTATVTVRFTDLARNRVERDVRVRLK